MCVVVRRSVELDHTHTLAPLWLDEARARVCGKIDSETMDPDAAAAAGQSDDDPELFPPFSPAMDDVAPRAHLPGFRTIRGSDAQAMINVLQAQLADDACIRASTSLASAEWLTADEGGAAVHETDSSATENAPPWRVLPLPPNGPLCRHGWRPRRLLPGAAGASPRDMGRSAGSVAPKQADAHKPMAPQSTRIQPLQLTLGQRFTISMRSLRTLGKPEHGASDRWGLLARVDAAKARLQKAMKPCDGELRSLEAVHAAAEAEVASRLAALRASGSFAALRAHRGMSQVSRAWRCKRLEVLQLRRTRLDHGLKELSELQQALLFASTADAARRGGGAGGVTNAEAELRARVESAAVVTEDADEYLRGDAELAMAQQVEAGFSAMSESARETHDAVLRASRVGGKVARRETLQQIFGEPPSGRSSSGDGASARRTSAAELFSRMGQAERRMTLLRLLMADGSAERRLVERWLRALADTSSLTPPTRRSNGRVPAALPHPHGGAVLDAGALPASAHGSDRAHEPCPAAARGALVLPDCYERYAAQDERSVRSRRCCAGCRRPSSRWRAASLRTPNGPARPDRGARPAQHAWRARLHAGARRVRHGHPRGHRCRQHIPRARRGAGQWHRRRGRADAVDGTARCPCAPAARLRAASARQGDA